MTATVFGVALGVGQQDLPLFVGFGADQFGAFCALGTKFAGDAFAFGSHALKHGAADFGRQIQPFDADVDEFDAEFGGDRGEFVEQGLAQFAAVFGDELFDGAQPKFAAHGVFEDLVKPQVGLVFVSADGGVKKTHITDSPFGERVDYNIFLFGGKKTLGLGVQGQNTRIKCSDIVDDGGLNMESRGKFGADEFAETKQDGFFLLLDVKHGQVAEQQQAKSSRDEQMAGLDTEAGFWVELGV